MTFKPFGRRGTRWEAFGVADNTLIRDVWPARGQPYCHTCGRDVFVEVLHTIDELNGETFTGEELIERIDAPSTQVFTALAFLKERSVIVRAFGRRNVAPTILDVYTDGMTEFHALEAGA